MSVCDRCGVDGEGYAEAVKELQAERDRLRGELAALQEYTAEIEEGNWPFEWVVATKLKKDCDRLRGELAEAQEELQIRADVIKCQFDREVELEQELAEARSGMTDEQARRIVDQLLHCDVCEFNGADYCKTCKRNLFDEIKQAGADSEHERLKREYVNGEPKPQWQIKEEQAASGAAGGVANETD